MKRGYSVVLSAVAFVSAFFYVLDTGELSKSRARPEPAEASMDAEGDPLARVRYEWMRLRNPETQRIPPGIRQKELAFAATLPTKESRVKSGALAKGQLLTWSGRGPYNVGGRTRALAIDASNENIMMAGGVSGGLWRTVDGGGNWARISPLLGIQSVTCIAQDTRAGQTATWYYGTGEYTGNSASSRTGFSAFYSGDGIYKTTNNGASWVLLQTTGNPQAFDNFFDYVWNVVTDPSNLAQDEVYAATYGAIWRSTNGTSFGAVLDGSPFSSHTDLAITTTGVLYATLSSDGTSAGIWRSPDGLTWTDITPGGWPGTYGRIVVGISPSNQNVVYLLAETPGFGLNGHSLWKYTYLSGDGGGAGGLWENRSANLPAYGPPVGNFDSQGSYDLVVKVKPDNENVVFIGGTNLYRSTNGFSTGGNTTWVGGYSTANNISIYPNHHPDQHSLAFLPSNALVLFSGHDGGLSKTTNDLASTVSWTSLNNGYFTTQFYAIAVDPATSNNNIIIGGTQDNGTWFGNTTSPGASWVSILGGDGAFCAIANGRTSYYASFQNGVTYRLLLDDNGAPSGNPYFGRVDPTGGGGYLFVNPLTLDPNNTNMMYLAVGDRVWRNSNLTAIPMGNNNTTNVNWTNLFNSATGSAVTALGVSTTTANRLYYGTDDGQVYRLDGANSGDPLPTDVWTGQGFPSLAYVACLAVDPMDHDNAMVVFSNYEVISLYYTANGGTSWTAVAGNLEQFSNGTGNGPSCRWVSILPYSGTTYYFVGTSTGIYSTTTLNGTSTVWALEGSSPIGNAVVDMVVTRPSDGVVVAGTHGNGAYRSTVAPTGVGPEDGMPASFALAQNYPNPFNPTTNIQYAVPKEADVLVTVINIEGREVSTLVSGRQTPGTYETTWDGTDRFGKPVASGVYFYRLIARQTDGGQGQAGDFAQTKRMVLLK